MIQLDLLEKYLIEHCSPTLASIKTASLFSIRLVSINLQEQLSAWNHRLGDKGITLLVLRQTEENALIYVCRMARLQADLRKPGVAEFLAAYGYCHMQAGYALERLKERLKALQDFPHEIGIFLGYPLGDVEGFIQNAGRNSKCTGCWKVYVNECETIKVFARYKKCRDIYTRLWLQGKSVRQLAVAC